MKNKNIYIEKGFTLVEVLIAIAIMSLLVLSVASMVVAMSVQEKRTRAITEVDSGASSIMDDISQSLRNASSITTPIASTTSTSTMTLGMSLIPTENPTLYSFATSTIQVTKGASTPYRMTNKNVIVDSISFQNLSATSTNGTIRVTLKVSYNNTANDAKLNYSTILITTVSLR
ncbi:prepilin-type N-terminal cleavage/methylation domain-containing protein [Arenimonas sp.]|nr:prepilin-type N-terminal cleavage/methylation domain-containing protein [Candidatus Parcubacteria bacterium]